jgi:hypothetical protein
VQINPLLVRYFLVEEILIIQQSGLPLYHFNAQSKQTEEQEESYILESAFFTAMTQYASEMATENIKFIIFEGRNYIMKKLPYLLVILSVQRTDATSSLSSLEQVINIISEFLQSLLAQRAFLDADLTSSLVLDQLDQEISNFLVKERIITISIKKSAHSLQETFQNIVFKSIGYIPGTCNIGSSERLFRLNLGLQFFVLAACLYIGMVTLHLPVWLRLFLVIPLFLGYYGLFQYFFKFCVTTALSKNYNMQ